VEVDWLDGEHGRELPAPMTRRLVARSGLPWYDARALRIDLGTARALCRGRSDLCHILYAEDALRYASIARRLPIRGAARLVTTVHQPPALFEELVRDKRPLQRADAVIAMSPELRDHLAGYIGEQRAFFVPLGVDTRFFRPGPDERRDPLSCLFVGWWQRDLDVLGTVVREVLARRPKVRFQAIVPPWAREAAERIPGLSVASGVPDEELLRSYRKAALLVLPLRDATANGALMEAAACGLPIVATAVGGVPHYFEGAAELLPPRDGEAMADRVLALLNDPDRRNSLGEAAHARARAHDWEEIARRHLGVYERVA
jgi:glycosyltransferase involved in cell wall biosynthesis